MNGVFRSFGVFNYRVWFAGALVSNVGAWMQRIAQDWIVYTDLSADQASALGLTMALQFGPLLVLGPLGGAVVDRFSPRRVLVATQIVQAGLALGLGLLTLGGLAQLWMVLLFALGLGIVTAVDNPARQTLVGELVPAGLLPNAVALNSTSFNIARLVGPAVAGFATAAIGPGWVFLVNAATFAATLVALRSLRVAELQPVERAASDRTGIVEGLRFVAGERELQIALVIAFLVGSLGMNFSIYTATMARGEFGLGVDAFGLLSSALAIGSIAGSVFSARRIAANLGTVGKSALAFGLACSVAAFMPGYLSFAVALVPAGAAMMLFLTATGAYMQSSAPPPLRGRVLALYSAVLLGTTPLSAPLVGAIVDAFGPRWGLGVGAAAGFAGAALGAFWFLSRPRTA